MTLAEYPLAVAVYHAPGCGACADLLTKLPAVAQAWAGCVPTLLLNTEQHGPLADAMRVTVTPTLVLVRHGRPMALRHEGAATNAQLDQFYRKIPGCVV